MADDDTQEKTEEATEKRKRESKEKGNIVRSKELNSATVVVFGGILIIFQCESIGADLIQIFKEGLFYTKKEIINVDDIFFDLLFNMKSGILSIISFLIAIFFITLFIPMSVGGIAFTLEAIQPKLDRLNPIQGIKKILSLKSLIETLKSIIKFCLVALMFYVLMKLKLHTVFNLDLKYLHQSLADSMKILKFTLIFISSSLLVITAIDIPYQIWEHARQLKMTKQEIREEHKDTEGKPEVKSKVRQLQREISKRRMMGNVPKADVIITNPTHYAVAIKYEPDVSAAPIVVAKGADLIAQMIIKVADSNSVPFLQIPDLARSIFYNVEIDEEIPQGLYVSVAKVLAYVFELKKYKEGKSKRPKLPREFPIPEELQHD